MWYHFAMFIKYSMDDFIPGDTKLIFKCRSEYILLFCAISVRVSHDLYLNKRPEFRKLEMTNASVDNTECVHCAASEICGTHLPLNIMLNTLANKGQWYWLRLCMIISGPCKASVSTVTGTLGEFCWKLIRDLFICLFSYLFFNT